MNVKGRCVNREGKKGDRTCDSGGNFWKVRWMLIPDNDLYYDTSYHLYSYTLLFSPILFPKTHVITIFYTISLLLWVRWRRIRYFQCLKMDDDGSPISISVSGLHQLSHVSFLLWLVPKKNPLKRTSPFVKKFLFFFSLLQKRVKIVIGFHRSDSSGW